MNGIGWTLGTLFFAFSWALFTAFTFADPIDGLCAWIVGALLWALGAVVAYAEQETR